MTLKELLERRDSLLVELDAEDITPERNDELVAEADQVAEDIDKARTADAKRIETRNKLAAAQGPAPVTQGTPSPATAKRDDVDRRSLGHRFADSNGVREFRDRGMSGQAAISLPLDIRATVDNAATSGGAFQNPSRPLDVPVTTNSRTPRVIDIIDKRTTDANTVEFVRDTSAAAPGTAVEVTEGAAKPEATFTFEVISSPVRTIAEFVNITRQGFEDNNQLDAYVSRLLELHVLVRLDSQIINGSGVAPNLTGILATAGINTENPAAAEARIITIRKAMTDVEIAEYAPDAVVLHPLDWEKVELSTDSNGMFRVSPNVQNALSPRIWGLTVVSTTAIASGTGLVGAFKMGATLWMRDEVRLLVTDSHASNFTANILTLLAELRAALTVWRPKAFSSCTFNGTT